MNIDLLSVLLDRTRQLHGAIYEHVGELTPVGEKRYELVYQVALMSLEHGSAGLALIEQEFYCSAYALMRPQFECLVRGIWLLYAADNDWVTTLSEELTLESAGRAKDAPMLDKMVKHLESCESAPAPLVAQLKYFQAVAWKALNSYAHGGFHPIARTRIGYPARLTYDVVRNSNGLAAMATQLVTIVSGITQYMERVREIHRDFADCLPMLTNG